MMKIIKNKVYDTEKSTRIAIYSNGSAGSSSSWEDLYLTKNGQMFIHGGGGPMSKYSVERDNYTTGSSRLWLVNREEAYEWLVENQFGIKNFNEVLENYFNDMVSEG